MRKSFSQPQLTAKERKEELSHRLKQTLNDTGVIIKTLPPQKNFEGTFSDRKKASPVGVDEFPIPEDTTHSISTVSYTHLTLPPTPYV